jgi:arylsulfatase A-like enzyme
MNMPMRPVLLLLALLLWLPHSCLQAAKAGRPNILHIHADDHRPDGLGALGNPLLQTPNLDSLVERGTTFFRCYTMGSMIGAVCTPSRTMMLTGRSWQRIPGAKGAAPNAGEKSTFLPSILANAGYQTWMTGKPGNAFTAGIRAFQTSIEDAAEGNTPETDRAHASQRMADRTISFLKNREQSHEEKPFFIYLSPPVPHDPRSAEERFHALYDPATIPLPAAFMPQHPFDNGEMTVRDEKLAQWPRTPKETKQHLADYYACISGLDHHVGRIFEALKATGQWENTLIIFSGDNGLSLGEHGLFGKQNLYEFGGMHVPLVIAGPGVPKGKSNALAYLMDLFTTLADYAGATVPEGVEGRSLRPVIEGAAAGVRTTLYTGYRDCMRAVRDERWKLIRYPLVDRTQLFDLSSDPHELNNLADHPEHAATLATLTAALEKEMAAHGDTHPLKVANPKTAAWKAPSLEDYRHLVRVETWTETWPDSDGKPSVHSVTAEVWTAAMQAALDERKVLHIPEREKPYYIDAPLVLKTRCKLVADPRAEIRLKPDSNCCMVRNANVRALHKGPVPANLKPDIHISIEGGVWTTLANSVSMNGNHKGHPEKGVQAIGSHGVILLQSVRQVSVRNVTIRESAPFGVHLANAHEFNVENITLDRHRRDGVHVNGPASDGLIRGVQGDSRDDTVALNAWEWKNYAPSYGPIERVLIEDVTGSWQGMDAIRLLPGIKRFDDGSTLDCPIRNVTLRRITDIREFKCYDQPNLELGRDQDFSQGVGSLANIRMEDLVFNRPSRIDLHANTDGFVLQKVQLLFDAPTDFRLLQIGPRSATYQGGKNSDPSRWVEIFSPDLDCTVRNVSISAVRVGDSKADLTENQVARVIEQHLNPDYPKTLPKGGIGRGIWVR